MSREHGVGCFFFGGRCCPRQPIRPAIGVGWRGCQEIGREQCQGIFELEQVQLAWPSSPPWRPCGARAAPRAIIGLFRPFEAKDFVSKVLQTFAYLHRPSSLILLQEQIAERMEMVPDSESAGPLVLPEAVGAEPGGPILGPPDLAGGLRELHAVKSCDFGGALMADVSLFSLHQGPRNLSLPRILSPKVRPW